MARNLTALLEKSVPPGHMTLIRRVAHEAEELQMPIYIVGGFVRDLLLGRAGLDLDLVVEGDAISLARSLASHGGGKFTAHAKFGTARWLLPGDLSADLGTHATLDLVSARSETYRRPAVLPTVKMGDLTSDIRRRDFTINTLAVRLDGAHFGELRDDLGGLDDLENRIIRTLHARSFVDDPTRMYRAVRYEQRYAFKIAPETVSQVGEGRSWIDELSAQRIRHELDLILCEPAAAAMLAGLSAQDLLIPIHPALAYDGGARRRLEAVQSAPAGPVPARTTTQLRWVLWLMPLSGSQIESVNQRLRFTAALFQSLLASSKLWAALAFLENTQPSGALEYLEGFPLLAVQAEALAAPEGRAKQNLEKYLVEWRHIKSITTGHDLKKLGLEPGPRYQQILSQLRAAWVDGKVRNEAEEKDLRAKILGET